MRYDINDTVYEKYRHAGKIAAEARDYGAKMVKEKVHYLDVVNSVESMILKNGGGLAFPVNISVDEVAAHFSPKHDDKSLVFKKGDVVKLDVGAHVDGYIADTAVTVEVGTNNYSDMIKASRNALENAIGVMGAGVNLSDVGKTIEDTIVSYGYKSIDNLTGHSLERYNLHSGLSVPNVSDRLSIVKPRNGAVLAVEPFATDGAGFVNTGEGSNIYLCKNFFNPRLIRDNRARIIFRRTKDIFKTLPFAQRWFENQFSNSDILLKKLSFLGMVKHYPKLIDANRGIVTQREHTVIVTERGCEVIT